jgi:hypothetical protein
MKYVLIAAVVAAGGWYWYDQHTLTESKIDNYYHGLADAFNHQDATRLCNMIAPEFEGTERQVHASGAIQALHPDKDALCKSYEALFDIKHAFDHRHSDSYLGWEYQMRTENAEISHDRKSADVHTTLHLNMGNVFIADSEGVDHLVIRKGVVLLVASEGQSRVDGVLAGTGE